MTESAPPGQDDRSLIVLGRLTRGALHELANPLLALTGSAELALAGAEPGSKLSSRLAIVHQTGQELADIVRALQGFVRSQREPVTRLGLAVAAESAAALVRRVVPLTDVELVVRAHATPEVEEPPGAVASALVELVLDALAGAERGDVVELEVLSDGDEAVARIAGAGELRLGAVR